MVSSVARLGGRPAGAVRVLPRRRVRAGADGFPGPVLAPGERVLAEEHGAGGDPILATDRGLYHDGGRHRDDAGPGWLRLGWEEIDRVGWDRERGVLTLSSPLPGRAPGLRLWLAPRTRLAGLARELVTSTVLATAPVRLAGRGVARVSARRHPGTSEVTWMVVLSADVEPADERIRAQVEVAIHDLRVQVGI